MKLQDQCCSREQGQRLVELGVKAESYFSHLELPETKYRSGSDEIVSTGTLNHFTDKGRVIPAFNVAELGELLPNDLTGEMHYSWYHRYCWKGHSVGYSEIGGHNHVEIGWHSTEAQARAELLIYLLENELICLQEK